MKSLLVASALAWAVHGSAYYISNYTVLTSKELVPFPLRVCVPDGALSYNYVVFDCANQTHLYYQEYLQNDPECGATYTDGFYPIEVVPGQSGYASCNGERSYMEIAQYTPSCSGWEAGQNGLATTVIAHDACVYYDTVNSISIYTRTQCNATGQYTYTYAMDPTCSNPAAFVPPVRVAPLGCNFFTNSSNGPVYSAMTRCVLDDVVQRCEEPISKYSSRVTFQNLLYNPNMWNVYSRIFPYATLTVENITFYNTSDQIIEVNVSFCTEWEDRKYSKIMKTLASATLDSGDINDNATICAQCVYSYCVNSTVCVGSSNCGMDCVPLPETTTVETTPVSSKDNKSAAALFVSFFTFFFALLFSVY